MNTERIINEVIDFIESRGRFTECGKYIGMNASFRWELFETYFGSLDFSDKMKTAHIITEGALGNCKELIPHFEMVTSLLWHLCYKDSRYFQCERESLEKEFNDSDNNKHWIISEDNEPELKGLSYKKHWRYPLKLWGILCMLKSDITEDFYNYMIKNSQSKRFRESLILARKIYDE